MVIPLNTIFDFGFLSIEVASKFEQALEVEEERITFQRKIMLLQIKKIRERENEMLIQARNRSVEKCVREKEHELENLLRNLEKQVTKNK